ncbi:hypothetical protein [Streptomyces sp. WAC06128]|uniref:hypothetical protein n=1 Tax=Streptomyces sp. WAC06128 TaxID=2487426 RepID=UPI000FAB2732|nr:hypothetical protein [Streptomyces sp. WAC06128]RSS67357.1 hypothetical protein EF911_35960 [Streptomyces sp. WAC06128]
MGWVHEDPDADLYDHEGYAVAVLADGSEPEPIQVPIPDRDGITSPNSAWWLYNGQDGRPLAAGVKAGCACGWRSKETFPVDFEDHEATEGFEFNEGPFAAWSYEHIGSLLGTAMPPELLAALDTVKAYVEQLVTERPLAALTALTRMESLAAAHSPTAGAAARSKGATWDAVGKAVGTTRQAAFQRFRKYTEMARTEDGLPIHIGGCTYVYAAHNDRCGCAGLNDIGQPVVPVVHAADAEHARHA